MGLNLIGFDFWDFSISSSSTCGWVSWFEIAS